MFTSSHYFFLVLILPVLCLHYGISEYCHEDPYRPYPHTRKHLQPSKTMKLFVDKPGG